MKAKMQIPSLALHVLQVRMQHHVSIFDKKLDHFDTEPVKPGKPGK